MAATKGIGRLIQFGYAKESTRGTAQSSATFWVPWKDFTLDDKKEFATDASAYGIIEDSIAMSQTKSWAEGSVAGNIGDTTFGLFLYSLFGGYAVSGSGPYTHTFTVGESAQHKSLTFFKHDPLAAVDYSYANGVVGKLEISVALKQFCQFTATLMAQTGASQSNFTPSTTSENFMLPQFLEAQFALNKAGVEGSLTATGTASSTIHVTACSINPQTNLKVGMGVTGTNIPTNTTVAKIVSATAYDLSAATTGAIGTQTFTPATIALKSAKLTIASNIEAQEVLGTVTPADFLNKEFTVEGQFEAILQNESDFKTQFEGTQNSSGNQPLALILNMYNSSSSGAEFEMPKCYITEYGVPYKVKDLVYQNIKFKAVYSVSDTLMAQAIVTNGTSTY